MGKKTFAGCRVIDRHQNGEAAAWKGKENCKLEKSRTKPEIENIVWIKRWELTEKR